MALLRTPLASCAVFDLRRSLIAGNGMFSNLLAFGLAKRRKPCGSKSDYTVGASGVLGETSSPDNRASITFIQGGPIRPSALWPRQKAQPTERTGDRLGLGVQRDATGRAPSGTPVRSDPHSASLKYLFTTDRRRNPVFPSMRPPELILTPLQQRVARLIQAIITMIGAHPQRISQPAGVVRYQLR